MQCNLFIPYFHSSRPPKMKRSRRATFGSFLLALTLTYATAFMFDALSPAASLTAHTFARQSDESAAAQRVNLVRPADQDWRHTVRIMWDFLFHKPARTVPEQPLPTQGLTRADLLAAPDNTVVRLGHSATLLKLNGAFWLTDPMLGERASPFPFMGPKRFQAAPIAPEELPPIKAVILSHDHYDHLDYATIRAIADKVEHFVAPLGVGDRLLRWGIPAEKVQQFDWWQETTIDGVRLIATPAQHFSGRTLSDANRTLWCSWAIIAGDTRVFFSGDSGYFAGFKRIGERFGPFDLALMETGAYNQNWAAIHMHPEETLQAFFDLRGQTLLPIHNATFDLSMHTWDEPLNRIDALAAAHQVTLATPRLGELLTIGAHPPRNQWWLAADVPTTAQPVAAH